MNLATITKKEAYSLLMSAIYAMDCEDKQYSVLGDLVMALSDDSLYNFLSLFEGQTIEIPTISEMTKMLTSMVIYTKHKLEKKPMVDILQEFGITKDSSIYREYKKFSRLANRVNRPIQIGGTLSEFPSAEAQVVE